MRILDIDLDLFLLSYDDNSHDREDNVNDPLFEGDVRKFLEENCGLNKNNPIEGLLVMEHHEAYHYWERLIKENKLNVPFEVVHADMHSDLYINGHAYIMGELLHMKMSERVGFNREKMDCANYLIFALACGWISDLTYVTHFGWKKNRDLQPVHFKDWNTESGFLELKGYDSKILKNYSKFTDDQPQALTIDDEIPFRTIMMDDYKNKEPFDFVVLCRSERYTPKESDSLIPIIMEYIKVK
ncbi:UPF0489 family protein [Paenibacillus odorifer]|uniref:UPF0489 family protein n=1 Tax=Paenibacillus odorifer TaxID=189426 RepID=UPI00096FEF5E|nr:UPF0489 family protein [Paenibacillus odorifer]OMD66090.1 hypothetical protein BSK50_30820 [Paenibacillus odorifer]